MKFKKLISCVTAAAMAVAAMAVSTVSVSAAESISCKLYSQNTNSWTVYESDAFDITTDGGDFTVSLDAGSETDYITLYIKDVTGAKGSDAFAEGVLTVNSIKVNGKKLGLTKTEYPLLNESSGILDVCFINGWADTFVTADEAPMDENGDSFTFGDAVSSFEVDFSVSFGGAAAPAEDAAAEETVEEAADETPAEPVEEEAVVDEVQDDVMLISEEAPAADTTTTAAATGNAAASAIAVVMVAAGAVAVASKRK